MAELEPTPEPEPEDTIAQVGTDKWFTYEDGLQMQVTKVTSMQLADFGTDDPGGPGVEVTVTVKNGTGSAFDLTRSSVGLYAGPNGDTMEQAYGNNHWGFEGSIPPTKAATTQFDFAVPTEMQGELLIEVAPSWDHQASFSRARPRSKSARPQRQRRAGLGSNTLEVFTPCGSSWRS